MKFSSLYDIKGAGFTGFLTLKELCADSAIVPDTMGVYLVINLNMRPITLLQAGMATRGKPDMGISLLRLQSSLVAGTPVLYIGRAGSENTPETLRSHL